MSDRVDAERECWFFGRRAPPKTWAPMHWCRVTGCPITPSDLHVRGTAASPRPQGGWRQRLSVAAPIKPHEWPGRYIIVGPDGHQYEAEWM